ncbi:MAG TPA: response regulator [Terriglobales bacterium]|nr:response regulator [Terriglobales bacterium]
MSAEKPLIQVIDDDPSHLQLYDWIVQRAGFRTHPVLATGKVDQLALVQCDLSLIDYRLGPLSSLEVAKRLKSLSPGKPIVVMSDSQWMPEDFDGHATAFVRKGDPQLLLDTIGGLVG